MEDEFEGDSWIQKRLEKYSQRQGSPTSNGGGFHTSENERNERTITPIEASHSR